MPPLNPIANNRYREKSFGKGAGISKSDLHKTAITPIKKNKTVGANIF